jgi:benzoylformate decarboxylase
MANMLGRDALMQLMRYEEVEYVFGIPGATEIHFMDALEEAADMQYVLGLNEIVCAAMAEGYARASGRPGFLNLHTGPGVAAALPMIYNAWAGGVPMVITSGQQDTRLLQYDPHLSGDIVGMGKLYTKWCTEIVHAEDIPTVIQRAFKMAIQPPAGPVLVSIPQNVLAQDFQFEYKPNTRVYSGLRPDQSAIRGALAILRQAKRPVIFVESGVTRCHALSEVVRFAELIGAKVFQNWMSDVNFPVIHPQYLGDLNPYDAQSKALLKDADVLIGVGCPMFDQGFFNADSSLPKGIKTIQLDENPWEIGKNFPVDCGLQGDIKATLSDLSEAMKNDMPTGLRDQADARAREISQEKAIRIEALEKLVKEQWDDFPISISRLMTEINEAMTSDTVIVDDCWSSSAMLRQICKLVEPNSFYRARRGGSIGWGLPGALGVKLGLPEKQVLAVSGDGSAAWSMQSLWTAARYNIPVTFVITNNATYRQVKLTRKIVLGDYPLNEKHDGMELDEPVMDFCMLAQSMGVKGKAVRKPEDLASTLKSALRSNEPNLIEVFVENRP